jgi:hypothetical protein
MGNLVTFLYKKTPEVLEALALGHSSVQGGLGNTTKYKIFDCQNLIIDPSQSAFQ